MARPRGSNADRRKFRWPLNSRRPVLALTGMAVPTVGSPPTAAAAPPSGIAAALDGHLRCVWRHLRCYGCDPATADDLAQQVFVVAVEKHVLDCDPPALAVFLHRTARFVYLRHVRDRKGAAELADAVDELWARDCAADGGDARLEALRACVEGLSGRARDAVERCYGLAALDARRHDSVAAELGLLPNGLKTLLQRVRQQLRACIERRLR